MCKPPDVSCCAGERPRRRAVKRPSCGAITFVQRFGSGLQLNVHFHLFVPDGVLMFSRPTVCGRLCLKMTCLLIAELG
jgi:hypothetical protein